MRSKNIKPLSMKDPKREMSKEQTPITADGLKKTILQKLSQIFRGKTIYMAEIEDDIEQYAQTKVLEALEREFTNYENNNPNKGHIEHYETEVKPKYK